jgi:hypothetical protein
MRWIFLLAAMACGAQAVDVRTAQTAFYRADADKVLAIVSDVTAQRYTIGERDYDELQLITAEQWYTPDGSNTQAPLIDRSIRLQLIVSVIPSVEHRVRVTIVPKTFQHREGRPRPHELQPEDPNLPRWVRDRVDELWVQIHGRLHDYVVPDRYAEPAAS